ncbi:unnamed protein product [Acanthoscelides obtectus]|uniref:Endonuclease/exonuclease/phosphatase domain-containing protein n=1 Tax=Acanthoscelides obtectus TaxID=200917 RepID=A0A9P0PS39_ACAOB|nr:unnamed protein product [Acanthoscelides obtectus]CAK1621486.1 hypothetical protein AOBTE_LOCUS988 [Acanthoscelides obtectus]
MNQAGVLTVSTERSLKLQKIIQLAFYNSSFEDLKRGRGVGGREVGRDADIGISGCKKVIRGHKMDTYTNDLRLEAFLMRGSTRLQLAIFVCDGVKKDEYLLRLTCTRITCDNVFHVRHFAAGEGCIAPRIRGSSVQEIGYTGMTDELSIMGDININLLRHTNITNQFNNLLDTFNFKQVVINPTRYSRDTASLIDVIIMSDDQLLSGSVHHQDLHQHSDHQLIHCSINIKISAVRPRVIKYRNFKHFDIYSFKQDLINFPWWQVVDCDNVNQKTAILSDMILTLFDSHAPICEKKVTRPPSPWFTDALRAVTIFSLNTKY